ncbi:MAG: adenylate/guanylate cyclase domain-containing protein [Pseudomonadota bacterium]
MTTKNCVVFFADLADSVTLYAQVGDAAARSHVLALQRSLSAKIDAFDGRVHQIVGDELMVCFDDPDRALACSMTLHRDAEQYSRQHAITMQLRIGMHYGEIIEDEAENRLFGDTVNTASRVNGIAQAGQTILTQVMLDHASPSWAPSVRQFDETRVKGKADILRVYDLPWQTDELTTIVTASAELQSSTATRHLVLSYQGQDIDLSELNGIFSIGRAITNDLVVNADSVSRRHVTVERVRDHFVLSDKSTNGTHLLTESSESIYLRREQWPMSGSGEFSLGAQRDQYTNHTIAFRCGVLETC